MGILNIVATKKQNDLINSCSNVLSMAKVDFTNIGLYNSLEGHVEYPSILAIKDTLTNYGIESAAIRKGKYNYSDFETPFICSIQKEEWPSASFTLITKADADRIEYLDPTTNKLITTTTEEFEKVDKNIILLLDDSNAKSEANLAENKKKQIRTKYLARVPLFLLTAILAISIGNIAFQPTSSLAWYSIGFILTSFIGLAISALLIWHEVDAHNPFIKEVCGGNTKKLNCNAVLSSSKSSFLGLSWSSWGAAFFLSIFTMQFISPADTSFLTILSALSLLVSPYILFSVYYQWKTVKQWCPLCLAIQAVLLVNLLIATVYFISYNISFADTAVYNLSVLVMTGLTFLYLIDSAIPILKRANDSKTYKKKWEKLRYNPEIFQALLDKSEGVNFPADELGIVVGNPNATNEIIKVCNPYCGPCSKAHPELEHIVKSNADVKVRIIFNAFGAEWDKRTPPTAHLLAIQQKLGAETVHTALDDWYLAPSKDYEAFAAKYPMNGDLKQQTEKIHAMRKWCNDMKIRATPTIYINGRELPDSYGIAELKNFF